MDIKFILDFPNIPIPKKSIVFAIQTKKKMYRKWMKNIFDNKNVRIAIKS